MVEAAFVFADDAVGVVNDPPGVQVGVPMILATHPLRQGDNADEAADTDDNHDGGHGVTSGGHGAVAARWNRQSTNGCRQ